MVNTLSARYPVFLGAILATFAASWLLLSLAWNLFFFVLPGHAYYQQHLTNTYPAESMVYQLSQLKHKSLPGTPAATSTQVPSLRALLTPYPFNNDAINATAAPARAERGLKPDTSDTPVTQLFPVKHMHTALMVTLLAIVLSFGFAGYQVRGMTLQGTQEDTRRLYRWTLFAGVNAMGLQSVYLIMFFAGLYTRYGT